MNINWPLEIFSAVIGLYMVLQTSIRRISTGFGDLVQKYLISRRECDLFRSENYYEITHFVQV